MKISHLNFFYYKYYAVYLKESQNIEFDYVDFKHNHLKIDYRDVGGAIYSEKVDTFHIRNCNFFNNTCKTNGGSIFLSGSNNTEII